MQDEFRLQSLFFTVTKILRIGSSTATGAQSMDEDIILENWFWHRPRRLVSGRRRMLTSVPVSVQRVRKLARQGGLKPVEAVSNKTSVTIGKGRVNQYEEARLQRIAENQKELNRVLREKNIAQNSVKSSSSKAQRRKNKRARCTDTSKTSRANKKRNGRPRELPEFVPRVKKNIANAPELQQFRLKAASVQISESRAERRQKKQAERARNIALQRERSRIQQMIIADRQACAKVEAEREKCAKKLAAAEELQRELAQVSVALKSGQITEDQIPARIQKQLKKREARHCPHTKLETRNLIRELWSDGLSQRKIAKRVGVAQSTVSYVCNHPENRENHAGRPQKLTPEIEAAAARFRFLFHQQSYADTAKWIEDEFGIKVSANTVQRHLKSLGFRMGDFKRYPRDRNSDKALLQRYNFATR